MIPARKKRRMNTPTTCFTRTRVLFIEQGMRGRTTSAAAWDGYVIDSHLAFRTAVPFWGQTNLIPSVLYPKRDWSPNTRSIFRDTHSYELIPPLCVVYRANQYHVGGWEEREFLYSGNFCMTYVRVGLTYLTAVFTGDHIINRTYGIHKNLPVYISLFLPTIFGAIYYGPP